MQAVAGCVGSGLHGVTAPQMPVASQVAYARPLGSHRIVPGAHAIGFPTHVAWKPLPQNWDIGMHVVPGAQALADQR
jgi:hypothetical protein